MDGSTANQNFHTEFWNWNFEIEILKLKFWNWNRKIEILKIEIEYFSVLEFVNFQKQNTDVYVHISIELFLVWIKEVVLGNNLANLWEKNDCMAKLNNQPEVNICWQKVILYGKSEILNLAFSNIFTLKNRMLM